MVEASPQTDYDVVVIGAGLAGYSTALALKNRGKKVLVLRSSAGATQLSSGAWDLGRAPLRRGPTFVELLKETPCDVLIDQKDYLSPQKVQAHIHSVASSLSKILKISVDFEQGFLLPTSAGRWKRTYVAQEIQSGVSLGKLKGKKIGFVTSDHFRVFSTLLAQNWNQEAIRLGYSCKIEPFWLPLDLKGGDWAISHVAARLQSDPKFRAQFKKLLLDRLSGSHVDFLIFPPLFVDSSFFDELKREARVEMAECLATTEPIAGKRLHDALLKSLEKSQVRVEQVSSIKPLLGDRSVKGLEMTSAKNGPATKIEAKKFVLATGKLLGGGLSLSYGSIQENVFGLPLFMDRTSGSVSLRSQLPWRESAFSTEQPWAKLGVWVNEKHQPRNDGKEIVYKNLYATGTLLGGVDFSKFGFGLGFAAYSGSETAHVLE